jgi:glycosyltransferase involved in cell wall biosynthesis
MLSEERLRVVFIVRSLDSGGAERQLAILARGLPPDSFDVTVASMYSGGTMRAEFERIGHIRLVSLDKGGRWHTASFIRRLHGLMRTVRPHVVHGYMTGANEVALLAARMCGAKAVWGIRVSDQDFSSYTRFRRMVYRGSVVLSRFPDLIIANSEAGRRTHIADGYSAASFIVIPNGIDAHHFRRDAEAGEAWRRSMGWTPDDFVVGYPARFDPMKDHSTFIAAAALFAHEAPDARFFCAGRDDFGFRSELETFAASHGLSGRLSFLPAIHKMTEAYSGMDVLTLTSAFGEGFPNVLGEAMACEVPCVTTPSGDAAAILDDPERIVPFRDPEALVKVWRRLRSLGPLVRREEGRSNRERICANFSVDRLLERTSAALIELAHERSIRSPLHEATS